MPQHTSYTSRSAKRPTKHKKDFHHRPNLLMPEVRVTSTEPPVPKPGECIVAIGQKSTSKLKATYFTFDSAGMYDLLRLARDGQHILGEDTKKRKKLLTKLFEYETARSVIGTIMGRVEDAVPQEYKYLLKPRAEWVGRHPSADTQPDVKIETDDKPEKPYTPPKPIPLDDPEFDILADARQGKIKYPAHRDNAKKKRAKRGQK